MSRTLLLVVALLGLAALATANNTNNKNIIDLVKLTTDQQKCIAKCLEPSKPMPPPKVSPMPAKEKVLEEYSQCGGLAAACKSFGPEAKFCVDAAFPDHVCPKGFKCVRQNQWYYQCVPK